MPTAFRDILFPTGLAYGFHGGPGFNTTVLELGSGFEKRNINWSKSRAKYDISHLMKDPEKFSELLDWMYAMMGRAYSFKFWDNFDDTITTQVIGIGDGVEQDYQIFKRYSVTNGVDTYAYDRLITKIQPNTLSGLFVGLTGPLVPTTDYTIDLNTGVIHFVVAPPLDDEITIGSVKFYVHVRFEVDEMDAEYSTHEHISWGSISLIEIKEESSLL